ncbi:MAG: uroporphyrinogen decarboxylase family protein [Halanaerobiaceae bacterium]
MSGENTEKYREKLKRYTEAMNNKTPDRVPIRPFTAEFTGKYAGYSCQEITHDYNLAFEAALACARDFDWDAVVGNMVYVWTGLTQALDLKYYGVPGIDLDPEVGFQYKEPSEENAFMKAEEYDRLIENPTRYLYEVWLPRVSGEIGGENKFYNDLALVKGSMSMLSYFNDLGEQNLRLKEVGAVPAISGILKAPLDIIGDKLRGYFGLAMDLMERPEKVLKACKALMPHLLQTALGGADPENNLPVTIWMHRGCVPLISQEHFENIYWTTLKPIIMELWARGHQTLFYAEGNWDHHLDSFAELPEKSIIYHIDRGDVNKARQKLGDKFCLSGGFPNHLLTVGTPERIKNKCEELIDIMADKGGYIFDASAIIQNDAKIENVKAMTECVREYGKYQYGIKKNEKEMKNSDSLNPGDYIDLNQGEPVPGVCRSWKSKARDYSEIKGNEQLVKQTWDELEGLAHMFIWHCLVSF